jgi:pyruvate/2-oxoglutarate dehydrogenase complex dihydrolipoamide dehydrogenase (E3) component
MNERAIPEGEFDYVIVGAGTAGYVLANRMSQERASAWLRAEVHRSMPVIR